MTIQHSGKWVFNARSYRRHKRAWLTHDRISRVLLISSVLLVLLMELINSAIEATVDRISDERHPLAKRAKDIGSATVFISIVNAMVVWALILV